jgi:hypothetical protein
MLSLGSCGSEATPDTERDAEVYAAVIRALAAQAPPDVTADDAPDRVIFVGPLDEESPISLEVQAATVEQFENAEIIRFVDHREEPIDSELPEAPVRDDGILILVGTVPGGSAPSVDAELYVDRDDVTRFTATAQRQDGEWTVVSLEPSQ